MILSNRHHNSSDPAASVRSSPAFLLDMIVCKMSLLSLIHLLDSGVTESLLDTIFSSLLISSRNIATTSDADSDFDIHFSPNFNALSEQAALLLIGLHFGDNVVSTNSLKASKESASLYSCSAPFK